MVDVDLVEIMTMTAKIAETGEGEVVAVVVEDEVDVAGEVDVGAVATLRASK